MYNEQYLPVARNVNLYFFKIIRCTIFKKELKNNFNFFIT